MTAPTAEVKEQDARKSPPPNPSPLAGEGDLVERNGRVNAEGFRKLETGMRKDRVEAVLGVGRVASPFDLLHLCEGDEAAWAEWEQEASANRLKVWRNEGDAVFVAFDATPDSGGNLKKKLYTAGGKVVATE